MLAQTGYRDNQRWVITVNGYVFTFYRPKRWVKDAVQERVKEIQGFYSQEVTEEINAMGENLPRTIDAGLGNIRWFEGEEEEQVSVDEVKDVGFYYLCIEINDRLVEKTQLRRGYTRTIWSAVIGFLRRVIRA